SKTVCDFVEGVSKEGAVRRQNLRWLGDYVIQFLQLAIESRYLQSDTTSQMSDVMATQLHQRISELGGECDEILATWIERTIRFQSQVDANMATANIVPSWLNDLGRLARSEPVATFY
ncbi:MAG: hypothetical protein AAGA30_12920, partial [Planctomycetota bacterium]